MSKLKPFFHLSRIEKSKYLFLLPLFLAAIAFSCNTGPEKHESVKPQSQIIKEMIDAVNEKNAEKYVRGFANDVQVFVESEMKVDGIENLKNNRATHFKNNPQVRSEIQHLVEIDNKVILHDKVWLNKSDKNGQDVVEIFTFQNGKVSRVDVIQAKK